MHEYIVGPSQKGCRKVKMESGKIYDGTRNEALSISQPFVLFGAGGAGKSALLSKCARQSLKVYDYELSMINLSYLLSFGSNNLNQCPGMVGPCQALANDQILWHHPKLHGSWPPAQVGLVFL